MIRTRIIPCLLYSNGGLYKSVKFKNHKYLGDPVNIVKIFNEKEVDELIFLDIGARNTKTNINYNMIENIASECFMPVCYGGNITKIEEIHQILKLGIEKVSINTSAFENPNLIKEAAQLFGSQSIVVSIDAKKNVFGKYEVYTHNAKNKSGVDPVTAARKMQEYGAGEILINSVDQDGTMKGYDLPLIKSVADAVDIPVIALGGAGSIEDLSNAVNTADASAVAAGSLFVYYGPYKAVLINVPDREKLEKIFQ